MSFLNNMVQQFTHQGQNQQQQQGGYSQQSYQQSSYSNSGPGGPNRPQTPPGWEVQWDSYQSRWFFVNRQTGERSYEHPGQNRAYGGGYQQQSSYSQQNYGQQGPPPPQAAKSHNGRNVALGALAGVAGGALLMHEGDKVKEHWDEDKYRMEESFEGGRREENYNQGYGGGYGGGQEYVQNDTYIQNDTYGRDDTYVQQDTYIQNDNYDDRGGLVDDAARWTGEKVQEVEDIPEDIDRKWDNFKDDVEDIPEDVAYGVGDAVGDVERFGDNVDNAYDAGRDEQRYDDDNRW